MLTLLIGIIYLPVIRAEPIGFAPSTAVTEIQENLWSVALNSKNQNETVIFVRKMGGKVFAAAKDLQRWRLRLLAVPPLAHQNEDLYALDDLGGTYRTDEATQSIAIEVSGDQFMSISVSGSSESSNTVPSTLGGFLNYDAAISDG